MKRAPLVFAAVFYFVLPMADFLTAAEESAARDFDALIASLVNSDKQIREAAYNVLLDEELETTRPLVDAVLEPANSEKLSSAAAIVLVQRLSELKGRSNHEDRTKPVINLQDSDKRKLLPLLEYIELYAGGPSWRWYLAVSILDRVDAAALSALVPALNRALDSDDPMLQYGAVKAIYHNSQQAAAQAAKSALLNLLYRPRPPFRGVYLRGNRLIEDNRLAYANDVRVYADVETTNSYERIEQYYGDGALLISETLLRLGATYDEIGPRLVDMAARYESSIRVQAIRQLVQLGPTAQYAAAVSLRQLLLERDEYLIRTLAGEHPALVGDVVVNNPQEQLKTINLFGQLGASTRIVVAPLSVLLRNGDERVRHVAANILGQIGTQDLPVALNELRVALGPEVIAPLTELAKHENKDKGAKDDSNKEENKEKDLSGTATSILGEIAQRGMVVSVDKLQSISDKIQFNSPPRAAQEACFRAMLDAAVKLQAAERESGRPIDE